MLRARATDSTYDGQRPWGGVAPSLSGATPDERRQAREPKSSIGGSSQGRTTDTTRYSKAREKTVSSVARSPNADLSSAGAWAARVRSMSSGSTTLDQGSSSAPSGE